ncbi:glycosyl hydrolases family 18-domain-containing protein [Blastocladiella britannica]|nr:glycosyl hydrolases family 18-domain-containing protein [Blastocladiella britannica]
MHLNTRAPRKSLHLTLAVLALVFATLLISKAAALPKPSPTQCGMSLDLGQLSYGDSTPLPSVVVDLSADACGAAPTAVTIDLNNNATPVTFNIDPNPTVSAVDSAAASVQYDAQDPSDTSSVATEPVSKTVADSSSTVVDEAPTSTATATSTLTSAVPTQTPIAGAPTAPNTPKLIAYYQGYKAYQGYKVADLPIEDLSHVIYAFAKVENAQAALSDAWIDAQQPNAVTDAQGNLITILGNIAMLTDPRSPVRRRNPSLKVVLSIGGWTGSKDFSTIAASPALRATFAQSAAALVQQHNLDGVDIDWEFPGEPGDTGNKFDPKNDGTNFTRLLAAVSKALAVLQVSMNRKDPFEISVATSAAATYYAKLDVPGLAKYCSHVLAMTYDKTGSWSTVTGHQAGQSYVSGAISGYAMAGLPLAKFAFGVPYYSRAFANVQFSGSKSVATPGLKFANLPAPPGTTEAGVIEFDDLAAHYAVAGSGYTRVLDTIDKVPVFYNVAKGIWITGEDEESAYLKGKLARTRGVGAVFVWDPSMDRSNLLTKALRKGLTGQ